MYFRRAVPCDACGKVEWMPISARMTRLCYQCQHSEPWSGSARGQRKAGLLVIKGKCIVPAGRKCRRCGELFVPQRTTARFCSAKCRVYFHRGVVP